MPVRPCKELQRTNSAWNTFSVVSAQRFETADNALHGGNADGAKVDARRNRPAAVAEADGEEADLESGGKTGDASPSPSLGSAWLKTARTSAANLRNSRGPAGAGLSVYDAGALLG